MHALRRRFGPFAIFLLPLILFTAVECGSPPQKWHAVGTAKRVNLLLLASFPPRSVQAVGGSVKVAWEDEEAVITDYSFWEALPDTSLQRKDAATPTFRYPLSTSTLENYPFDRKAVRSRQHSTQASLRELWDYERRLGNLSESEKKRRTDMMFEKGRWKLSAVYILVRCSAIPYQREPRDPQAEETIRQTVIKRLPNRPAIVGEFTLLEEESARL